MKILRRWVSLGIFLMACGSAHAQTLVGTIDVGTPNLVVEITTEKFNFFNNNWDTRIVIQVTNLSSLRYECNARIGFFHLNTGSPAPYPVDGEIVVTPGGPWIIVETVLPAGSSVATTSAYDSAECSLADAGGGSDGGSGGGGGGGPGEGGGGGGGSEIPELRGTVGYSTDSTSRTLELTAGEIANPSATRTTGTLRLELWALTSGPYGGAGASGYRLGAARLPSSCTPNSTLGPGVRCVNARIPTSYSPPAAGTYTATMFLTQYSSTCTAADKFCVVDYRNFSKPLTIVSGGGVAGNGRGIEIVGQGSWSANFTNNTVRLEMEQIRNASITRTTGTIRIELWATDTEYQGDSISGYRMFTARLPSPCTGQLAPGASCNQMVIEGGIESRPEPSTYFVTLIVSEFDSQNCSTGDNFCIATAVRAGTVNVPVVVTRPVTNNGGGTVDHIALLLLALLVLARYRIRRTRSSRSARLGGYAA